MQVAPNNFHICFSYSVDGHFSAANLATCRCSAFLLADRKEEFLSNLTPLLIIPHIVLLLVSIIHTIVSHEPERPLKYLAMLDAVFLWLRSRGSTPKRRKIGLRLHFGHAMLLLSAMLYGIVYLDMNPAWPSILVCGYAPDSESPRF